ncbi:CAunnamed protein product [Biomphalaria glabrata]|nr:CAunnamed protein product [Biomphalaria glabrata]
MPSERTSLNPENKLLDRTMDRRSDLSMVTSPYLLSRFLLQATNKPKRNHPTTLAIQMQKSISISNVQCESPNAYDPNGPSLWVNGFDTMSTSDHSDTTPDRTDEFLVSELSTQEERVSLPCRYRERLMELSKDSLPFHCNFNGNEHERTSREEDLTTALRWIRQEILEMKEQDKSLQKQFIELRTSILQLRCLYEMQGSYSDVSSLEGSTYSLNEPIKSPKVKRLLLEGDNCLNQLSISLPSSPMVERFKWRNDEYI